MRQLDLSISAFASDRDSLDPESEKVYKDLLQFGKPRSWQCAQLCWLTCKLWNWAWVWDHPAWCCTALCFFQLSPCPLHSLSHIITSSILYFKWHSQSCTVSTCARCPLHALFLCLARWAWVTFLAPRCAALFTVCWNLHFGLLVCSKIGHFLTCAFRVNFSSFWKEN